MENEYRNVMERADRDAVKLNDKADLHSAAEGVQNLFDQTFTRSYGQRSFLVNSYVNEMNKHADDIYGKGQHIKLEIIDSNKNERLDLNDQVTATRTNGEKASIPVSAVGGNNFPYEK